MKCLHIFLLLLMHCTMFIMARRHHHMHLHTPKMDEELRKKQIVQVQQEHEKPQQHHRSKHRDDEEHEMQQTQQNDADNNQNKYQVVNAEFIPYSKSGPGRHVCTSQRAVKEPVKTIETWCKPTQKRFSQLCHNNQICHGVRLVYETAYRDVTKTKTTHQITYVCCPGWSQVNKQSYGCNKPICNLPCQNGGVCTKPNHCTCKKGFRGKYCEHDMNECKEQKPCDQICHNIPGSYFCECRENFILQPDKHSCKKEGGDGPALEAKDLEFDNLNQRILKLEKLMGSDNYHDNDTEIISDLKKSITVLTNQIKLVQNHVEAVQDVHTTDLKVIKERLAFLEQRTSQIVEKLIYNNVIYPTHHYRSRK